MDRVALTPESALAFLLKNGQITESDTVIKRKRSCMSKWSRVFGDMDKHVETKYPEIYKNFMNATGENKSRLFGEYKSKAFEVFGSIDNSPRSENEKKFSRRWSVSYAYEFIRNEKKKRRTTSS